MQSLIEKYDHFRIKGRCIRCRANPVTRENKGADLYCLSCMAYCTGCGTWHSKTLFEPIGGVGTDWRKVLDSCVEYKVRHFDQFKNNRLPKIPFQMPQQTPYSNEEDLERVFASMLDKLEAI